MSRRLVRNMARARVVYIMGAGRSGSTVLGITLGNISRIFYAGDVSAWVGFRGVPNSDVPDVHAFWDNVRTGMPSPDDFRPLNFRGRLEHPAALLRPWTFVDRNNRKAHQKCNALLFHRILEVSQAEIVVDSAHSPLRARLLLKNPQLDVFLVYLTRDPRDVINAFQKKVQRDRPMPPLMANLYCLVVWCLSTLIYHTASPEGRLKIRYEDFLSDPAATINRIVRCLGIENDIRSFDNLYTGPVFQGNRIINERTISILPRPDKPLIGRGWRVLTNLLQLPVLVAGGYLNSRRLRT